MQNQLLTSQFNSEEASLNTFKNLAIEFNPTFTTIEAFNNTTMNSIESTGKIELLNNALKKELLEYKSLQANSLRQDNTEIYLGFMHNFTSKYRFGKHQSKYINELNSKIKNEQEYVNTLTHLISYKNYLMNSSLSSWRNTKEKALNILAIIETSTND